MADKPIVDPDKNFEVYFPNQTPPTVHLSKLECKVGLSINLCDQTDTGTPKGAIYCIKRVFWNGKTWSLYPAGSSSQPQEVYMDRDGFVIPK